MKKMKPSSLKWKMTNMPFAGLFLLMCFVSIGSFADAVNASYNNVFTYNFSKDIARASTPSNPPAYYLSVGRNNGAKAGVVSYTDANGLTSNVLKTYSQGAKNATGVIDLNAFPKFATDYSVTWKSCVNSPTGDYKTGVILRGDTAKRGTATANYVQGIMEGYLLLPFNNGANGSQFRIYKSTSTGLSMLVNTAVPSLVLSKSQPVWYRATVSGSTSVALKIEYSTDSVSWLTGATATDAAASYKSGATQFVWGLAITSTDFYVDNITYNGQSDDALAIPANPEVPVPGDKLAENEHARMNITVDGVSRTMLVYVPKDLPQNRPLLVSFSGMNMNDGAQADGAKYWMVADTAKFLVVYPNPVDPAVSWDMTGTSDLNFFSAIIDKMYELYKIDRKRVYISGFSWGGNFCYRIANNLSEKVAAMGTTLGHAYGPNPNVAVSAHPMPLLHVLGIYDTVFKPEYVQPVLDNWIARNGCPTSGIVTKPYPVGSTTSVVEKTVWKNASSGVEVMLLKTPNGHSIPNDPAQIMSNLEVWNFCKRYTLDSFTALPQVTNSAATLLSQSYFSLSGQLIQKTSKQHLTGLFIVKNLFSDGTTKSELRLNPEPGY
jgi:poly(3-hydroxybutyrate) depolymerase